MPACPGTMDTTGRMGRRRYGQPQGCRSRIREIQKERIGQEVRIWRKDRREER